MAPTSEITIHEDRSEPGGGFAVIRVTGVAHNPGDAGFSIRRIGYDRNALGRDGWQGPDTRLYPLAVRFHQNCLYLKVGPDVVDVIEVGTPIDIEIPAVGVRATLHWPEIAPSVAGHDASRRTRIGFGSRTLATPAAKPAPAPELVHAETAMTELAAPAPPPPRPRPAEEPEATLVARPRAEDRSAAQDFGDPYSDYVDGDFLDDRWDLVGPAAATGRATDTAPPEAGRGSRRAWLLGALMLVLLIGALGTLIATDVLDPEAVLAELGLGETPQDEPPAEGPDQVAEDPGTPPDPAAPGETAPDEGGTGLPGAVLDMFDNLPSLAPAEGEPAGPDAADDPPSSPDEPPPPEEARVDIPSGPPLRDPRVRPVDFVNRYLRDGPTAEDAFEEAGRHLEAGDAEVALLMFEHGAEQGYAPSIMAIGRMYDPVHFAPSLSAFTHANPLRAAQRYQEAATQGSPEAAQALTELRAWLEAAATRGDQDARTALEALQPLP